MRGACRHIGASIAQELPFGNVLIGRNANFTENFRKICDTPFNWKKQRRNMKKTMPECLTVYATGGIITLFESRSLPASHLVWQQRRRVCGFSCMTGRERVY